MSRAYASLASASPVFELKGSIWVERFAQPASAVAPTTSQPAQRGPERFAKPPWEMVVGAAWEQPPRSGVLFML
jgi:hypothetical protein